MKTKKSYKVVVFFTYLVGDAECESQAKKMIVDRFIEERDTYRRSDIAVEVTPLEKK